MGDYYLLGCKEEVIGTFKDIKGLMDFMKILDVVKSINKGTNE